MRYSPLLPLLGEDAVIAVGVEDPDGLVAASVQLSYWPVSAAADTLAPPGSPAQTLPLSCTAEGPGALRCPAPLSPLLAGPAIVRIELRADDRCGAHAPTLRRWEFAAGLSADGGRPGWGLPALEGAPLPVLRRPGDPAQRIDLGFVDTGEHFPGGHLSATRALLAEAIDTAIFGAEALDGGRELWSFYLEPAAADACTPGAVPGSDGPVDAGLDLHVALCPALDGSVSHLPQLADTASTLRAIYTRGDGASVQALPRALRHELGHAAFYLSDEYGRVNGGSVLDTTGPAGGACDQPTWFNNLLPLESCRWYWRCFRGAEGACEAPEWEPAEAARVVESGEGCVMAQTHSRGGVADFAHSCGRRAWRIYEALTGAEPLSLVCRYGGRAAGCEPIDACTRRARLEATLAGAAPPPIELERLHIRFRGGEAIAARRERARGYPPSPPPQPGAAALLALRGDQVVARAELGAFWLAQIEAGLDSQLVDRLDFDLSIRSPLADPARPPDGYLLVPLTPDGSPGEPFARLEVEAGGGLRVAERRLLPISRLTH